MRIVLSIIAVTGLFACTTTESQEAKGQPANGGYRPAREAIAAAYKEFEKAFYNGDAETIARTV